jgi:hypothetical protein
VTGKTKGKRLPDKDRLAKIERLAAEGSPEQRRRASLYLRVLRPAAAKVKRGHAA